MSIDLDHRPEAQSPESTMRRIRHNFAQTHGIDVSEEPVVLDAAQKAHVKEEFKDIAGELEASAAFFNGVHGGAGSVAKDREDKEAHMRIQSLAPGESVLLVKPPKMSANTDQIAFDGRAGPVARATALKSALSTLGFTESDSQAALEQATINVFPSPHNGAPILAERVIAVGDYTIHEMNLHAVGQAAAIDSQVAVIKGLNNG